MRLKMACHFQRMICVIRFLKAIVGNLAFNNDGTLQTGGSHVLSKTSIQGTIRKFYWRGVGVPPSTEITQKIPQRQTEKLTIK